MESEDHFDDDFLMRVLRDPAELNRSNRQNHVDLCEICRGRLNLYQSIQSFLKSESDFEVPSGWLERMVRLFDAKGLRRDLKEAESYAWLAFDSLLAGAQGIRSTSAQRHLIWESPEFRVDMMVESANRQNVLLIGQLTAKRRTPASESAGAVVEAKVGDSVFSAELNSIGEFVVSVGRLPQNDPIEVLFRLPDRPLLTLLIPF